MKNSRLFVFVFGLIFLSITGLYSQKPTIELKDINNIMLTYSEFEGDKLTVIDFWATWCPPCIKSIPELNRLYLEFQEQGVNFVGISIDGPRNQSKLKPFVNSLGVKYTVLRDVNSEVASDYDVSSVPTLMIFDSEGEIVFLHEGFRPGDDKLIREQIEKYL
jgi:cytochrome c biogenesis protein CcmG/thiol:disulfide interchange protein DsbE